MHFSLLLYDIPERAPVRNPSPRLRRLAVRINLSCWVVPEDAIPWNLLDGLTAGGASWHVVKFDASEAGNLLAIAAEALRRDVLAALVRARRSEIRAGSGADGDVAAGEEPRGVGRAYLRRVRAALARARRLLDDFRQATKSFGIEPGVLDLEATLEAVNLLQAVAHDRARLYAQMTAAVQTSNASDDLARAARDSAFPPLILADLVEDRGGDASAARNAFGG